MTAHALNWGILGPGNIARRFASQLADSATGRLVAVASRDAGKAEAFAREFGAERSYSSYEELLADPGVDAVYISLVHTLHAEWTVKAADAGKHVLVEKPIAVNHGSAMVAAEAARRNGVVLLEAYMYRFHPQIDTLLELVSGGAIGSVQHIDTSFSFDTGGSEGRLFDESLAGGGILDVGGYPVSLARLVASAALGRRSEPISLTAQGSIGETNVDEWATATLQFDAGISAHVRTGVRLDDEERVVVYGSHGTIQVHTPWVVDPSANPRITVRRVGEPVRVIECPSESQYAAEADAVAAAVTGAVGGTASSDVPRMTIDDSLANLLVLDQWRAAIGLRYSFERDDATTTTVSGEPLAARENSMVYGRIPGIDKDVSRLVMGCDNQQNLAHASAMFDDFTERGGNAFDTGYIYGGGLQERLLGQWISNRGLREQAVVIAKGAHTPHCDPESITRQLTESLERLQTDYVDIYLMHRDNEDIPVGEFVDVLDEHARAGRIRAFGGSNWSLARFDEANAYAEANGRQHFGILSNHFGLAEAYDVPWDGCRHATDDASKLWLKQTQTPLFPWSSQARGFFTGRARPDDLSDPELVRCYYGDGNFERLRRAEQLGAELGVMATAVALAYVLHQPFPTFPLFGPRSIAETRTSLAGLSIELTDAQVRWLDLAD
ncbi:aldo/keto reductase [Lacisediminihabitans profunda]|uniref:Oxidoreductase n=1 Tax=Lacisediminihabitans profunda TaxID=2594790 RepID=A0A5C8URU4_9MICO|nr:aldo/keto reductase [Lacisediminihabitans profunda]TXN31311.1 oxidoreductase [Lacisediminihabitans profunda]